MKAKKNYIIIFYSIISCIYLRGILLSPGIVLGGDWSLPLTLKQAQVYAESGFYLWKNLGSVLGIVQPYVMSPVHFFFWLLAKLGINGEIFSKFLLLFLFTLSGFSMYNLCRFLDCEEFPSILGGLFFFSTPIFFNYTIMGWAFVLLPIALLPFAIISFIKSIKEQNINFAIVTGFLYITAFFLASQSLIWYPLTFILLSFFIVRSQKEIISAVKSMAIIFSMLILMNIGWIVPLLIKPTSTISKAASGTIVPLGQRLSSINLLRLWGSLYNYQYESAFPSVLLFATFIPPIVAFFSLILKKKDRMVMFFATLSFIPFIYFQCHKIIHSIPFTIIIRDVSRFIVFSTLAYSVLIAITIDALVNKKRNKPSNTARFNKYKSLLGYVLAILVLLISSPFWKGELYGTPTAHNHDIRLRTIKFPDEYYAVENMLSKENSADKALYLPLGGTVGLLDDKKFKGSYKEFSDIFSYYSPIPGQINSGNRMGGLHKYLSSFMQSNLILDKNHYLSNLLNIGNIKYIIIRLNMYLGEVKPSMKEIANKLDGNKDFRKIYEKGSIVVFENTKLIPRIYAAPYITPVFDGMNSIMPLISSSYLDKYPAIAFSDEQNKNTFNLLIDKKNSTNNVIFTNGSFNGLNKKDKSKSSQIMDVDYLFYSNKEQIKDSLKDKEKLQALKNKGGNPFNIGKHQFYISEDRDYSLRVMLTPKKYFLEEDSVIAINTTAPKKTIFRIEFFDRFLAYTPDKFNYFKQNGSLQNMDFLEQVPENINYIYKLHIQNFVDLKENHILSFSFPVGKDFSVKWKITMAIDLDGDGKEDEKIEKLVTASGINGNRIILNINAYTDAKLNFPDRDSYNLISLGVSYPDSSNIIFQDVVTKKLVRYKKHIDKLSDIKIGEGILKIDNTMFNLPSMIKRNKNLNSKWLESNSVSLKKGNHTLHVLENDKFNVEILEIKPEDRRQKTDKKGLPGLTFQKINPTQYIVEVKGAKKPFPLVFSETYHDDWKAYIRKAGDKDDHWSALWSAWKDGENRVEVDDHFVVNGYANGWIVPAKLDEVEDFQIVLEYKPQRLFEAGLLISSTTLLVCIGYLVYGFMSRKRTG